MSFVARIIHQGLQNPSAPALSVSGRMPDIVTYGVLTRCIANVCRRLSKLGIEAGKLYGLHVSDDLLYIVMTLALEHLGAATVIVADPERVAGWPIAGIFVAGGTEAWAFPTESIDQAWLDGDGNYRLDVGRRYDPDGLCSVIWTSGSTGTPKGIPLTHRLVELRIAQYDFRIGPEFIAHDRVFCSPGFSSGWGYNILIHTLSRGRLLCLSAGSLDQSIRKIAAYKVESLIASPLDLGELCALSRKERRDLQSLKVIGAGGGILRKALVENIRSTLCSRLVNSYSAAEAGWVAGAPVELLDLDKGESGFVAPGVTVEIVDPVTRQAMPEGVGCVRVRSDCVAPGYFGGQRDDAWRFDGNAFCTNDLATLSAGGVLSILGRHSNVVNVGGPKSTLEIIETHYAGSPGVAEAASVIVPDSLGLDRLIAFVVPTNQWSEEAFWAHCHGKIAPEFWPKRLVILTSLPRGSTGKVDRQLLASLV